MTTKTDPAAGARRLSRLAHVITEILAPWVIVLLLPPAVAWHATGSLGPTLGWGLLVSVTSSILPMAVIVRGARTGRWDGHHVRDRADRAVPFAALITTSLCGLALLLWWQAPRTLVALDIAMIASLLVTGGITMWWKVSMHASVAAGAAVILAVVYGPWYWLLAVVVAAVGWSRVRLRDHTPAQVVAGMLVGAVGGGVFTLL